VFNRTGLQLFVAVTVAVRAHSGERQRREQEGNDRATIMTDRSLRTRIRLLSLHEKDKIVR